MRQFSRLCLFALVLAGCAGGAPSASEDRPARETTTTTARRVPLREAWTAAGIDPVAQPVIVGDVAVTLGVDGESLFLYGVDVDDGSVRWRQEASPGEVVTGIAVYPRVIDERLVYFRPDPAGNLFARLVSADPETGSDRWVSEPVLFRSNPDHCADGRDLCLQLRSSYEAGSGWIRFDPRQGFARPEPGLPGGSRELGDGVLDLGEEPEVLAGFDEGGVRWRLPVAEAFSAEHSSDGGWYLVTQDEAVIGSIGRRPPADIPERWEVDLAGSMTAGIDAATGDLLWNDRGSSFACGGALAVSRPDEEGGKDEGGDHDVHPLRCRLEGTMVYGRDVPDAERVRDLDVVVERIVPRTGEVEWSAPLGAATDLVVGEEDPPMASERAVVVPTGAGFRVLDVVSGERRVPEPDEVVWCSRSAEFRYREPYFYDGEPLHDRRGGTLVSPCRPDGSPADALPKFVPSTVGAHRGPRSVLATPDGLVAYDRG